MIGVSVHELSRKRQMFGKNGKLRYWKKNGIRGTRKVKRQRMKGKKLVQIGEKRKIHKFVWR